MKVFFYPHDYLRDRHLDTIRRWPKDQVVNPELADRRRGAQVSVGRSNDEKLTLSLKQKIPLLNLKMRPKGAPKDAVIYCWGGLIATGDFIIELDNPWSMVGYRIHAMPLYRPLIRRLLLSDRCRRIRCISAACRESLRLLFGEKVFRKAEVCYPCIEQKVTTVEHCDKETRFLFIGTQFEIKGGEALLKAFGRIARKYPDCRLDIVTHLPPRFSALAAECPNIVVHEATFSREQIHSRFMAHADVLVLPTYVESFGMAALEALAHGLALIATDVYALKEMVLPGKNGNLIAPPLSIWNGYLPSPIYRDLANVKRYIREADTHVFEEHLASAIERFIVNPDWRLQARRASVRLMAERFAC